MNTDVKGLLPRMIVLTIIIIVVVTIALAVSIDTNTTKRSNWPPNMSTYMRDA